MIFFCEKHIKLWVRASGKGEQSYFESPDEARKKNSLSKEEPFLQSLHAKSSFVLGLCGRKAIGFNKFAERI